MADPFIGEIRLFAGNFAPLNWAFCNGATQAISENDALFSLIGTTYGGDGQQTFNLPDLRGRVPVHQGQGAGLQPYVAGQNGGAEQVTLTAAQIPAHTHVLQASTDPGTAVSPAGALLADSAVKRYFEAAASVALHPDSVTASGGSQPHDNRMPFLAVSYIIALFGIYPAQA